MGKELCQVTKNLEVKRLNMAGAHHSNNAEEGKLPDFASAIVRYHEVRREACARSVAEAAKENTFCSEYEELGFGDAMKK